MEQVNNDYYNGDNARTVAREFGAKIVQIIGQRSNGKSFDILKYILTRYKEDGVKSIYVRRWREDIKKTFMNTLFAKHDENVRYYQGAFYYGEEREPFALTTSLSASEHFKGFTATEDYKIIFFDECFTKRRELPNEFDTWQEVLSTIVRNRDDVEVYMVGNTVKRTSCYFTEYNIDVRKLKKGSINQINVTDVDGNVLKIVCEWCMKNGKASKNKSMYFVNRSGENMLSDGDFESSLRHTQELNGVDIGKWSVARRLPFAFMTGNDIIELRVFNGVLLVKYGRKTKYNISKKHIESNDGRQYPISFPFYTNSQGLRALQLNIKEMIKENQFVAESVEIGEILTEIIGGF